MTAAIAFVQACGARTAEVETRTERERVQRYEATATVHESQEHGPMLCLGGVMDSLPPQCGDVPITNWDWDRVPGEERLRGTVWGLYHVVGTYDGAAFTVEEAAVATTDMPALSLDGPPATACPEPAGGWSAPEPGLTRDRDLQAAFREARSQLDFAGLWVEDRRHISDAPPEVAFVLNAAFTGDLARAVALTVLRTSDGGASWVSAALPPIPPTEAPSGGEAHVQFVSLRVGWVSVRLESSSNFSRGALFGTKDGGVTWTVLSIPIGEPVRFLDEETGWTAGGAAGDELYITRDGGATWQRQAVTPPPVFGGGHPTYQLPFLTGIDDGVLPVTFSGDPSGLAFYETHDRGQSCDFVAALTIPERLEPGVALPVEVIGQEWVAGSSGREALYVTQSNGRDWQEKHPIGLPLGLTQLDFGDAERGWALTQTGVCAGFKSDCRLEGRLLSTADGGGTWTDISP